ncbi:MAG: DUF2007 domain-containing protein, partial [Verrucomicrobiae bacterium]|nr:DUF2007 domain-containing protein [Verrucomicrobiae bacterium]
MAAVNVFHTFNPAEAQLVRSRLEAADIPATILYETAGLSVECYTMGCGGILVQVPEECAEDARALLSVPTLDK